MKTAISPVTIIVAQWGGNADAAEGAMATPIGQRRLRGHRGGRAGRARPGGVCGPARPLELPAPLFAV
ncbi:MAG: hypothetical protein KME26_09870 [Oscillatoria princeps RMCB-10]|nr:hypothetical protein [Oscillatoria princeps RMCB-10]